MPRLTLTQVAAEELECALADLGGFSLEAAARLNSGIHHRLRSLAEFPEFGRRRPEYDEFAPGVRSTVVGRLVVFYHIPKPAHVEVLRVLDGRRDIDALLLPER